MAAASSAGVRVCEAFRPAVMVLAIGLAAGCGGPGPAPQAPVRPAVVTVGRTPMPAGMPVPSVRPVLEDPPASLAVPLTEADERSYQARARFLMALMAADNGDTAHARQLLRDCIGLDDKNPLYPERLGLLLLVDPATQQEGRGFLERAAALGTDNSEVYYRIGNLLREAGDPRHALANFTIFVDRLPVLADLAARADFSIQASYDSPGYRARLLFNTKKAVLVDMARMCRETGDQAGAVRVLSELAAQNGRDESFKVQLAALHVEDGDYPAALQVLNGVRNMYDLGQDDFTAFVMFHGLLARVPGFYPAANRQAMFAKVNDGIDTYLTLKGPNGPVLLAGLEFAAEYADRARAAILATRIMALPDPGENGRAAMVVLAGMGAADIGLDLLSRRETERGLDREYTVIKGQLSAVADPAAGEAVVTRAVAGLEAPVRAAVFHRTGVFFTELGRFDVAGRFFTLARETEPGACIHFLALVEALFRGGQPDQALTMAEDALARKTFPDAASALQNLVGYFLVLAGRDVDRAVAMLREAHAAAPDDPAITDSLGWALFTQGDMEGAGRLLKAAAVGSEHGEILAHMGDYCRAAGDPAGARRNWIRSYVLHKDPEVLRKIMESQP
ncbi:MAG: hypothetical protein ABIF71_10675 [Planctomycetota bacterium]